MSGFPFDKLLCKPYLEKMGYSLFHPDSTYLSSSTVYTQASFQNKETDPTIYTIRSIDNTYIKLWSNIYGKIGKLDEDEITFNSNLYINDDRYIVFCDEQGLSSLVSFEKENVFQRPVINNLDDRYDLGDILFVVSNSGILFSLYEHPMRKTVDRNSNSINIRNQNIKFEIQEKTIGSYRNPFKIKSIHVFPGGSLFDQRQYNNWE